MGYTEEGQWLHRSVLYHMKALSPKGHDSEGAIRIRSDRRDSDWRDSEGRDSDSRDSNSI